MRFTFITTMNGSPWGGSEELWSQAAIRLKQAGHDVQAAVLYWPRLSDRVTALRQYGIHLEMLCLPRPRRARRIWNKLSLRDRGSHRWLEEFNPDLVIISQGHNQGGFGWAKICREASIPYAMIVQCNSEMWWFEEHALEEAASCYTSARRTFCVSRSNLDLLRLQVAQPLLNGEVVWNPCKVSPELPPPAWPDESRGWRLACVARMDPGAKGQDLLLQLMARPEWRERPAELNLFGTGPYELGLRRAAQTLQLKNVHFRGHVNDVRAIWEQNHLLILPSRYEGLPLALVEAMWCARPSVVTDVGGNAELCVDQETGFVAPAATVASFGDTLQRAWERREEWLHMGQAARARVEAQISKDPVEVFCEHLKTCVTSKSAEVPVRVGS